MKRPERTRAAIGRPCRHPVLLLPAALMAAVAAWPAPGDAQPAQSGAAIVQDAIKEAQQDQARDAERVRNMVDEAVKRSERSPSGEEAVNPPVAEELRPLEGDVPGTLPAGMKAADLVGKPLRDGTGAEIGRVRGLALDQKNGLARVVAEFGPMFGQPPRIIILDVETLQPADKLGDGYIVELRPVEYEDMSAYTWQDGAWRQAGS